MPHVPSIVRWSPKWLKRRLKAFLARRGLAIGLIPPSAFDYLAGVEIGTFLDIGAYRGTISRDIRQMHPRTRIHAFEPNPSAYARLMAEMGADELFDGYNVAVSSSEGTQDFHIISSDYWSSFLLLDSKRSFFRELEECTTIQVPTISLDSWAAGREFVQPIAVKIDVQGMEREVIAGARQTLEQSSIVILQMLLIPCFTGQPLFDEIYGLLRERGFGLRGLYNVEYDYESKEQLWVDALFFRHAWTESLPMRD